MNVLSQFTIELRVELSSNRKRRQMAQAMQVAARHAFATAVLLTKKRDPAPQIVLFEDNFFDGHKSMELM